MDRRLFLQHAGSALIGVAFIPLSSCEFNSVEPITIGEIVPFITPNSRFYVKQGADVSIKNWQQPNVSTADWALTIDGLVSSPLTVRYADLQSEIAAGRGISIVKTLRCVIDSNEVQGLIATAVWTGVSLKTFLDKAGVNKATTKRFFLHGYDGFTNNMKLARVYTPEAGLYDPILVTQMNGVNLPVNYGGPVRLLLNESFGYKNVKWIKRVEATSQDIPFGTYQDVGFADDGVMRVSSRGTNPLNNAAISAGVFNVSGFAVSGAAAIQKVEISIDGGAWQVAKIDTLDSLKTAYPELANTRQVLDNVAYPYRGVWVKWSFEWNATAGSHVIRIRATDALGQVQTDTDTNITDGINAIPKINVVVT